MVQFLLSASQTISQISDLIGSKWAEILGWVSIPTVGSALIVSIIKLISSCISKKIASKNLKPIASKVEEAKNDLINSVDQIEKKFNSKLEDYSVLMENKFNECFAKYSEAKQVAFNKLIEGEAEVQETLKDVEEVKIKIESVAQEIEKCETVEAVQEVVEPIVVEEPVIVETVEVVEEQPEEYNNKYLLR